MRRLLGCSSSTLVWTLALVACTAAWAQDPATAPVSLDAMSASDLVVLVLRGGWPAVVGWLGHRALRLLENGAKATEAGRPMLRVELVHKHDVNHRSPRAAKSRTEDLVDEASDEPTQE